MRDHKKDILEQKDKGIGSARGALARLFRTVLYDLEITGPKWETLMQRVLDDPRGPAPRNSKDRSSLKGNLNKALKGDTMTWKNFQKAMHLLGPSKVRLELQLSWPKGRTTVHFINLEMGGFRIEDYLDDEEESPKSVALKLTTPQPDTQTWDPSDPQYKIREAFSQIERMCKPRVRAQPHARRPAQQPTTQTSSVQ